MAGQSKLQRQMVIGLIGLVVVQIGIAGGLGFKPSFKSGYFKENPVIQEEENEIFDAQRLRELEAILAPAPVLAWSNLNAQDELPKGLASTETLLSFADDQLAKNTDKTLPQSEDGGSENSRPEKDQSEETSQPLINKPLTDLDEEEVTALDNKVARLELAFNQTAELPAGVARKQPDHSPFKVAPIYVERLPDLERLTPDQRKKRFVAIMLPLIIRSNQELMDRRQQVADLIETNNQKKLRQWAQLYRLKNLPDDHQALGAMIMARVNTVPVSIALGQAAIESGWGTSRFAIQGNALYGQWAWSQSAGLRPNDASNEKAVVRSFANLFDSVRAYMHNLNTHHSYESFRSLRNNGDANKDDLIDTLINYSEERDVYVSKLKSIIAANGFDRYDDAELTSLQP